MLKYMLDTNIVIYIMKKRPEGVRTRLKKHQGQMCISSITLGELIFGAEYSSQVERNLVDIEGFISLVDVLDFDEKAAWHFGRIRAELYKKGQPIGPYDMMIAGHARANGLILVTNNVKEFERVEGLSVENWV
ncbi:type II toxin-antitoxin system tRNA(fMet)-specific endonuclease VapC [Dissulfuribacter thermophilus]